jgi:hypothetical protein
MKKELAAQIMRNIDQCAFDLTDRDGGMHFNEQVTIEINEEPHQVSFNAIILEKIVSMLIIPVNIYDDYQPDDEDQQNILWHYCRTILDITHYEAMLLCHPKIHYKRRNIGATTKDRIRFECFGFPWTEDVPKFRTTIQHIANKITIDRASQLYHEYGISTNLAA